MPAANAVQLPPPIASGTVRSRQRVRVLVRQNLTDPWVEAPYLEAISCTDAVAPSMPQAGFRWRLGAIMREGQTQYANMPPIDLRDWFVKIELLGQPSSGSRSPTRTSTLWIGRFVDQDLDLAGDDPNRTTAGDQDLAAYGLAYELDRSAISSSVMTNNGTTASYVNVALTFNENYIEGFNEVGNRSGAAVTVDETAPARQGYVFSNRWSLDDPTRGFAWSLKDIVDYLLKFQGGVIPTGPDSSQTVPMFTLSGDPQLLKALDKLIFPNVRVEGLSVFQVLNELLDRRRGLGWCVRVDQQEKMTVHVFTTIGTAVVVGDALLPANGEASNLTIQGLQHLVRNQQFSLTAGQRYDKIEVTGEPLLVCFSLSVRDATLRKGWSSDLEGEYKLSRGSGASALDNDIERGDDKYRDVFTRYLPVVDWDGRAGDGEGGEKNLINLGFHTDGRLAVGVTGSIVATPAMRNWGRTFARSLPIRRRDPQPDDLEPEYKPLMALVYSERNDPTRPNAYVYADLADIDGGASASVRPLDRDPGIEVRFHPNHLLAKNHYNPATDGGTVAGNPIYDYEHMIVTVAMRTDERLKVSVDITENQGGIRRKMEIRIPRAETWYISKGTVTGLENGELKRDDRSDAERTIRDDSPHLRRVAAMAKGWYGTPRSTMSLTLNEVTVQPLGAYVRSVVDPNPATPGLVPGQRWTAPVNSVVSQLTHDLQVMRTTVRTHYAELDGAEAARKCPGYTLR